MAGIARSSVFDWKSDDPVFAREFEDAYNAGTDVYEAEARRKAFTEFDGLLIFLLKSRDPARFNRKTIEAVGGVAAAPPIAVSHSGGSRGVRIYIPANGRDRPERDELPTIEAERDGLSPLRSRNGGPPEGCRRPQNRR